MRKPDWLIGAGAWTLENSHRLMLAVSGGRFPRTLLGMTPIELHVNGRTSGRRYSTMLTAPICESDRIVIVASKGGAQDHPDWYKNLVANPDVEVTVDGDTTPMHAHTATPEEKAELWPRIVSVYKGYDGYQRNTERDIPVVICEPRAS
ncbi:MAG: nitroreductase family deazaflavin-dependent oxidoreductase [Frankiaceae bacterium]|nr:nitroreductase family deazaflavin-dependent oxidoreductase [Frankiaceae bacterium]MBV9870913.1 nitroreductase family deazaflavin-dependent oxidoreductase [Frankiaceae bacterium]